MRVLSSVEWQVVFNYDQQNIGGTAAILTVLYKCIRKAEALAYQKFESEEIHNGRGDALKHCYLSALLSKRLGEDFSKDFMDAHEDVPGNPTLEFSMDIQNNSLGRSIARKNRSVEDLRLGELCMKAVLDGRAVVIEGPGTNWPRDDGASAPNTA